MVSVNSVDVLNRLIVAHHRSLPMYLGYASPTWRLGDERARELLRQIAEDHQRTVDRLGELVMELGGAVQFGGFPMTYASYHDLGFDFLRGRLIEYQQHVVKLLEQSIQQLAGVPLAQALAQEALGAAKAHRELLEELGRPVAST